MKKIMLLCFLLCGCATTYQPQSFSGGYTDNQLNNDLFEVSFYGNGYTSFNSVSDMFLRRCAEITKQNGYDYFVFIDKNAGTTSQKISSHQSGTVTPNYYGGYDYTSNTSNYTVSKSYREGTIKLFKLDSRPEVAVSADLILQKYVKKP